MLASLSGHCCALVALGVLTSVAVNANTGWPHWRGPNANGSVNTGTYPTKWTSDAMAWKVALPGKGTSTPLVAQEKIFVSCPSGGQDALLAFDFAGRELWQVKLGREDPPKHRSLASSGNASPVSDGKAIFLYFKSGNFAAVDFDGRIRWKINLVERFGRDQLFWDQGTSPVVTDQHVFMARMHGGESWVAAFDKSNGELRWQQPRNYDVPTENDNGYATPVIFDHAGKKALLVWGADHLTAHDAATGKVLWFCGGFNPQGTGYWPAIATPAISGNIAIVPVGRDDRSGQARVHGVRLGGSGDVSSTHRSWKREDTGVFVASPTIYKDHAYLLRHRGEVVCIDPASGKTVWTGALPEHRSPYYSSPVIANGVMFAAREDGTVFTAKVDPKFELLGENAMGERLIASPVPVSGRVLLRGDKHLFCIGGK